MKGRLKIIRRLLVGAAILLTVSVYLICSNGKGLNILWLLGNSRPLNPAGPVENGLAVTERSLEVPSVLPKIGNDKSSVHASQYATFHNIKVKAVYLSGPAAGNKIKLQYVLDLIRRTELNAVVIDIKEAGIVNYRSQVPEVVQYGATISNYNIDEIIRTLHENNIYVIGRLVCFKDDKLAAARPDLAVKTPQGLLWKENGKTAWVDPYLRDTWDYNIKMQKRQRPRELMKFSLITYGFPL